LFKQERYHLALIDLMPYSLGILSPFADSFSRQCFHITKMLPNCHAWGGKDMAKTIAGVNCCQLVKREIKD